MARNLLSATYLTSLATNRAVRVEGAIVHDLEALTAAERRPLAIDGAATGLDGQSLPVPADRCCLKVLTKDQRNWGH